MVSTEQSNPLKNKISELKAQYKESLDKANKTILELQAEKEKFDSGKSQVNLELEKKLLDLEYEKNNLLDQIKIQNNKLTEYTNKINLLEKNYSNIEPELKHLKSELSLSEKKLKDTQDEINTLKTNYEEALKTAKINLNKATLVANKRKEITETLKVQIEQLEKNISELNEKEQLFEAKVVNAESQNKDLVAKLSNSEEKKYFLESQIGKVNQQLELLEKDLNKKTEEINKFNNQINNLTDTNKSLNNNIAELNSQIEQLNTKKTKLENSIKSFEQDNKLLQMQVEELQQFKLDATKEKTNLQDQLKEYKDQNQEILEKVSDLEKKEVKLSQKLEGFEKELTDNTILIEQLENEKQVLEKQYKRKSEELELDIKEAREAYELKLDIKERKITELAKNFDEELKQKSIISQENKKLADELGSISKSIEKQKQEYQEALESFELREKDLDAMLADYMSEHEKLNLKISDLNSEVERVNLLKAKEVKNLTKEKQDLQENINNLSEQNEKLKLNKKQEAERFDNEINSLISENSNLKVNFSKREIEIDVAKQDAISLKSIVDTMRVNHDKTEQEVLKLENLNNQLNTKIFEKEGIIREKESLISQYNSDISVIKSQLNKTGIEFENTVLDSNKRESVYKQEIENVTVKAREEIGNKDKQIKSLYEQINTLNNKITEVSEANINNLKNLELNKEGLLDKISAEKDILIDALKDENQKLINRISDFKTVEIQHTERIEEINDTNKKLTDNLSREIEELKIKHFKIANESSENKILINSLKKQNKVLEETMELKSSEVEQNKSEIVNNQKIELENNELKKQIKELNEKIKAQNSQIEADKLYKNNLNEKINETKAQESEMKFTQTQENNLRNNQPKIDFEANTYTPNHLNSAEINEIDEIYKTVLGEKIDLEMNHIRENMADELNDSLKHSEETEESNDEIDISKLEFYTDIIDEKAQPKKEEIKKDFSDTLKRPVNIRTTESETSVKNFNDNLDKVQESLSYLQGNKKSKQSKTDNTVFIMGGYKEIEEKWKLELEKCLQEYGLTHQWISNADKDSIRHFGKGVVFLISQNSLQLIDNSDLIMRNTSLPSVKHAVTNLTKLKLDIIDNFVRKK